jgi:hypothetical protein
MVKTLNNRNVSDEGDSGKNNVTKTNCRQQKLNAIAG